MSENENKNLEDEKKNKERFEKKEKEYKKRISDLEQQIQLERSKSEIIQNSEKEILTLRNEKLKLDNDINTLSNSNANQRDKLESLLKLVDDELKNINLKNISSKIKKTRIEQNSFKIKKQKQNQNIMNSNNDNNENIINEKNVVSNSSNNNELVNAKDKQIENINNLIEIFKKDNEKLKKKCKNLGDSKLKLKLLNKNNDISKQIEKTNIEIKKLKYQLKDHSKCTKIKDDYNKNICTVKDDIQNLKLRKVELINRINNQNERIKKQIELNEIIQNKKNTNKKLKLMPQNIEENNINFSQAPNIFTEKELDAISIAFNNDKQKCEYFLKKLSINENYIQSLESKHKFNIKQYLNRLNELDEQIEFLTSKFGEDSARNRVIKSQINEYQVGKISYSQKNNDLKNKIQELVKLITNKEKNIKTLTLQLNNLRKTHKNNLNLENIEVNENNNNKNNNNKNNNNNNNDNNNNNNKYHIFLTNNNNFEIENTDSQIIYPLTEKNDQLSDSKKSDLQNIKMKNENDYKKEEENNIENERVIY